MRWHCSPWKGYFKSSVEIRTKSSANSFISVHFDEPILSQLAEIVVIVEQQVEFELLHDFRSGNANQYLIVVEPDCAGTGVIVRKK